MIHFGCETTTTTNYCISCKLQKFPHRCNVYREELDARKLMQWEWIETPESSNIEMFAWEAGLLRVCFKNGSMYDYFEVPVSVYEEMKKADSKGKFLNGNLKGKFRTLKVE